MGCQKRMCSGDAMAGQDFGGVYAAYGVGMLLMMTSPKLGATHGMILMVSRMMRVCHSGWDVGST